MSKPKAKYKRWTEAERQIIRDNFQTKKNSEIAALLNRTPDSVRKEFNKIGLKRPLKSDEPKIPKKRGRKKKAPSIWDFVDSGLKIKREVIREKKRKETRNKKLNREVMFCSDFLEKKKNVVAPDTSTMIRIPIGTRTQIFVPEGTPQAKINKKVAAYKEKYGQI